MLGLMGCHTYYPYVFHIVGVSHIWGKCICGCSILYGILFCTVSDVLLGPDVCMV